MRYFVQIVVIVVLIVVIAVLFIQPDFDIESYPNKYEFIRDHNMEQLKNHVFQFVRRVGSIDGKIFYIIYIIGDIDGRVDRRARIREIVADAGSSFRIYGGSRGHG